MLHSSAVAIRIGRASIIPDAIEPSDAVELVSAVLASPDHALDYARAKLSFDRIVDSSADVDGLLSTIDRMVAEVRRMVGGQSTAEAKLAALRGYLHEPGPWNDHRPFEYDHVDFRETRASLMSNYLVTRRGNCVSMPTLFLILARKLGLDVALARAPSHLFVRHHTIDQIINLETTSGALPARDIWIRQTRRVSQRGVDSGLYMRSLSHREAIGAMALVVVEYLIAQRRYRDAIAVAHLISRNDRTDGISLAHQGNAYCEILKQEFLAKYGSAMGIPLHLQRQYCLLMQRNHAAFEAAMALGWEPIE